MRQMHTQFLPSKKSAVVLWVLFIVMLALLLTLSIWQWQRGAEKDALLARQVDRSDLPVIELTDVAELPADIADRPIRLRGHFLPEYRVALDNQMRQGRAGYEIHMAYVLEGHNEAVLVNLGWLPTDRDGGQLPPESFAEANSISGTAVLPSAFITVGQPELTRGLWRAGRIEPEYWATQWGIPLQPWVLRLAPEVAGFYQRDWAPTGQQLMSPDRHRAYAFQWFALALAWVACWWFARRSLLRSNDLDIEK